MKVGGLAVERMPWDLRGTNLPEFDGDPEESGDGSFRFQEGIRASSLNAYTALKYAQDFCTCPNEDGIGAEDFQISAKLFAILAQRCNSKSDALPILKGDSGLSSGVHGARADARVQARYHGRMSRILSEQVVRPPQVKYAHGVEAALAFWRDKYRRVESVFSKKPPDAGQVACLTSMLPKWAQEYVHLHSESSLGT